MAARTSVFGRLVGASNTLASLWVCVLMVLIVADVLMRSVFNAPIVGVTEIMEMSIVAMLYLQTTQALRFNRHTRSDAFFGIMERRTPVAAWLLDVFFNVAGTALMAVILYAGIPKTMESWRNNFTIGNPGVFSVPDWPLRAVIVFGCTLMLIQFAINVVQGISTRRPVASPSSTDAVV